MSKRLRIAKNLSLPMETVTSTTVIYGGRGMGKTNLGSVLCEELSAAKQRFAVIDPMGVWWGLRHAPDGKGKGIEVLLLGGRHADIPIEPEAGEVVADLVADEPVNCIIDISRTADGRTWSKGQKIHFVTDYITRLFERQGETRRPMLQIIDEAARFVPQTFIRGDTKIALCMGAIEQMVEEGRNFGIGVMLIAQRSARLNKAVAELADCMMAFRTVGPNSIAAIVDWFGEHVPKARWNELVEKLRELERGTALVVSPGWLKFEGVAAMRARQTYDSSKTPTAGKKEVTVAGGAKPDLARYVERMQETIERAEAADPRKLQQRVRELEAQLKENTVQVEAGMEEIPVVVDGTQKTFYSDARLEQAREAARQDGAAAAEREMQAKTRTVVNKLASIETTLDRAYEQARKSMVEIRDALLPSGEAAPPAAPPPARTLAATPKIAEPLQTSAEWNGSLPEPQQRILDGIAWAQAAGFAQPHNAIVAFAAGYSPKSTSYTNPRGALRTAGLIGYPAGDKLSLTTGGERLATWPDAPATAEELQQRILDRLAEPQRRILKALLEAWPQGLTNEQCASKANYTAKSTSYTNPRGSLKTLGLITYPEPGMVAAKKFLFLKAD